MPLRTSLKDIAQKIGVSTALVSYVLNNRLEGRINKEVARKIRELAAELNYRPNQIAKSLKIKKTNTIGLVVADISNPFSSSLARIIEDEAYQNGYTVIFGSSDESAEKSGKLIDTLVNRQVDGLIICPPAGSESQIAQLQKQDIPFIQVDRYFPALASNQVSLDNFSAAEEAVLHLLERGRKRIGLIGYDTPLFNIKERERGWQTALTNSGIVVREEWLRNVKINNDAAEIDLAVKSLISLDEPVDALLLGSNRIAAAALRYINSLSIRVPADLSLIGFDETEIFDFFYAPLTYVRQPLQQIGQAATKMLLSNLETRQEIVQEFLPAELVIRESTNL